MVSLKSRPLSPLISDKWLNDKQTYITIKDHIIYLFVFHVSMFNIINSVYSCEGMKYEPNKSLYMVCKYSTIILR